jgi:hypothetical protein
LRCPLLWHTVKRSILGLAERHRAKRLVQPAVVVLGERALELEPPEPPELLELASLPVPLQ